MKMNFTHIASYEKFVFTDKFTQKYKTSVCRCMHGRENGMTLSTVHCTVWGGRGGMRPMHYTETGDKLTALLIERKRI